MTKFYKILFFIGVTFFLFGRLNAQKITINSNTGNPEYIEFSAPYPSLETGTSWLNKIGKYPNNVSWKKISEISDELGFTHFRMQMVLNGVELPQIVAIIHAKDNQILRINGDFISLKNLKINVGSANLSAAAAREKALEKFPAKQYYWEDAGMNALLQKLTKVKDTTFFPAGKLMYIGRDLRIDTVQELCWEFRIFANDPLMGKAVYVNASNGEIEATKELIFHTEKLGSAITKYSGTRAIKIDSFALNNYRLRESNRGISIETYNMQKGTSYAAAVDFTNPTNFWNNVNANKDEVAPDAHWGAEMTFDYYKSYQSRNSYDNSGAAIYSYVHYNNAYNNAFWNGYCMSYGDGDGVQFTGPLTALDVCGHEITHAVTSNSANLAYSYESGALNESFSDIFGETIEATMRPTKWNWKIGEDITPSGAGIRDMSNPTSLNQPKYYKGSKWYTGTVDNGGVHTNSGVQNFWYYLIANGSKGTNEVGKGYIIDTLGFIVASKIAYRNLTVYLTPNSDYAAARKYSIVAATDFYGPCGKEVRAVTNAWWACGVGPKYDSSYVKADFWGDTLVCRPSIPVNFVNLTENQGSYKWYFGDGGTSTSVSPSHIYPSNAKYTVKLVATSCDKTKKDSITKTNFIRVDSACDVCNAEILPKKGSTFGSRCFGFVYDDGGEANYGGNKVVMHTINVPMADSIRFRFLMLDYENGYDSLVIYHTTPSQATKVGQYTGSTTPYAGAWKTVKSTMLIFRQYADAAVEGKGFKIQYISYRPKFTIDIGADTNTICYGDSFDFNPVVTNNYSPDTKIIAPATATPVQYKVGPKVTTKYIFYAKDICTGVIAKDSMVVKVRPRLKVTLGNDTTLCNGRAVSMTAVSTGGISANYQYYWKHLAAYGSKTQTLVPSDTIYKYMVILRDACSTPDTAYKTVHVRLPLKLTLTPDTANICPGTTIGMTAVGSGGLTSGYTYTWDHGLGLGTLKSPVVWDTTTFHLTFWDGCSLNPVIDSVIVNIPGPLHLTKVGDTVLCYGQSILIDTKPHGGLISSHNVSWNVAGISGSAPTLNPPVGTTSYKAILSDGCMIKNDTITFSIKKYPAITLTLSIAQKKACMGDSVLATFSAKGGDSTKYIHQLNGNTVLPSKANVVPDITNGKVIYTVSDGCSPVATSQKVVVISPSKIGLTMSKSDSFNCFGMLSSYLDVNTTALNGPIAFNWSNGGTSAKISKLTAGLYTLHATDTFGCKDSISATIRNHARVFDSYTDTTIYRGSVIVLHVKNATAAKWFGNPILGKDSGLSISVRPLSDTAFRVVGKDIYGCPSSDTVRVWVIDPPLLRLPNLITPNGDHLNDVWDLIELAELDQYDLVISDRFGKRVYSTSLYLNNFDGHDNDGIELPNGAYFYRLHHRKNFTNIEGYIQIIR